MIASGAGAIGIFFCILTIRWFGKRNLFLMGIIGATACEITLGKSSWFVSFFHFWKFYFFWFCVFHSCLWIHECSIEFYIVWCYIRWNATIGLELCWIYVYDIAKRFHGNRFVCTGNIVHGMFSIEVRQMRCIRGFSYLKVFHFGFRTRSFAIGLMFAVCCLIQFAAIKLHYNFEIWLTLPGTFALYGSIGVIG